MRWIVIAAAVVFAGNALAAGEGDHGLEVNHLGIFVEPGLVADLFLGNAANDVLERGAPKKGLVVGIDPDAFFASDLPQRLTGDVGVVKDLRVGRGNQQTQRFAEDAKVGDVLSDLVKNLLQQGGEFRDDLVDLGEVDPDAALTDGVDELSA